MVRTSTVAKAGFVAIAALSLAACHGSSNTTTTADNSMSADDNMLAPADEGNGAMTDDNMAMDNGAAMSNDMGGNAMGSNDTAGNSSTPQ